MNRAERRRQRKRAKKGGLVQPSGPSPGQPKHRDSSSPPKPFASARQTELRVKVEQGAALYQQGRLAEAEAIYEQVLRLQPSHFDALHLLGVIALRTGSTRRGVDLIQKAIAVNQTNEIAYSNLGNGLRDQKRHEDAVASYDKAIALAPDYAEAYSNRGVALRDLKRHEDAVASCDKAIALKPDYAEAYNNRGGALRDLDRHEDAIASYDKAIELKPDYAASYSNCSAVLRDLNRPEDAVASCDKAIVLRPDYAEAYINRGNALRDLKRHTEAVASYDKAIVLRPDYAEAYINRGNALCDLKRHAEAVASYDKAIELKPDYADAYNNCGVALYDLKRHEDAVASYDKAIALEPDYAEAHNNRGGALRDLDRHEDAIASYDKAIELKPDYADAHYSRSLIYRFVPGDADIDRLKSLSKQLGLTSLQRVKILSALGEACDQVGIYDEAYSSFSEANRAMARERRFDAQTHRDWLDTVKAIYAQRPVPAPAPAGGHLPVFVIGMSRSGKTLVASLLTQANHVYHAGESLDWLTTVDAIRREFGVDGEFPQYLARLSIRHASAIGAAYLERVSSTAPTARCSVNTLPNHCWFLGLILQAIPCARIIYCERNPMDCCLRIFLRWYDAGNSHSNELADIALYFMIYREIMTFWAERFGDRIFRLRYEEMVRNPGKMARALFDFCGLDSDPDTVVANFTTSDIGHWRNYEPYLTPLRDALEQLVPEAMIEVRDFWSAPSANK